MPLLPRLACAYVLGAAFAAGGEAALRHISLDLNVSNVHTSPLPAYYHLEGASEGQLPRAWGWPAPGPEPWEPSIDDSCTGDMFVTPQARFPIRASLFVPRSRLAGHHPAPAHVVAAATRTHPAVHGSSPDTRARERRRALRTRLIEPSTMQGTHVRAPGPRLWWVSVE